MAQASLSCPFGTIHLLPSSARFRFLYRVDLGIDPYGQLSGENPKRGRSPSLCRFKIGWFSGGRDALSKRAGGTFVAKAGSKLVCDLGKRNRNHPLPCGFSFATFLCLDGLSYQVQQQEIKTTHEKSCKMVSDQTNQNRRKSHELLSPSYH